MSDQPEALRLAEELDAYHTRSCHKEASAELRRLHKENERLRDALKVCLTHWLRDDNPDELQGDVARLKEFCHWEAALRQEDIK